MLVICRCGLFANATPISLPAGLQQPRAGREESTTQDAAASRDGGPERGKRIEISLKKGRKLRSMMESAGGEGVSWDKVARYLCQHPELVLLRADQRERDGRKGVQITLSQ